MLQFILGPAKSGKTEWILDRISVLAQNSISEIIFVVPEQFSFMCEKTLLQRLGPQIANSVKVYSFTKLCSEIGKEVGGLAGTPVDDGIRLLLAGRALKSLKGELKVFSRFYDSVDFAQHAVEVIQEFKQCGITVDHLRQAAENIPNKGLQLKIKDICLIMDTYNALLQTVFIDPLDQMELICSRMTGKSYFKGKIVFFDSFKDFTAPQLHMVEHILREAEAIYFSFASTADTSDLQEISPFSGSNEAIRSLRSLAKKNAVEEQPPVFLEKSYFQTKDLCMLAQLLAGKDVQAQSETENIHIVALPDIYREVDYVFNEISGIVRQDGARYRDFAIVARDEGQYGFAIENCMKKYNIPVYFDKRVDIQQLPLFVFVKSAFKAAAAFSTEEILTYIKTGLCGLTAEDIFLLENYCYIWNIDRVDWLRAWDMHPGGFEHTDTDATAVLEQLNLLRKKVVSSLWSIHEQKSNTAVQYGQAVYSLLLELDAAKHLRTLADTLETIGDLEEAACQRTSWDTLMDILDKLAICLGEEEVSADKFLEYFQLAGQGVSIGSLPEGLDDVIFGTADRIRTMHTKTVFLLGVNQGEFPGTVNDNGLLGSAERAQLVNNGVEIKNTFFTRLMDEKYWFYHAACLASERIYILYALADLSGNKKEPSEVIQSIIDVFPGCRKINTQKELSFSDAFLQAKEPTFEKLAAVWNRQDVSVQTAKRYFAEDPDFCRQMNAIDAAVIGQEVSISAESAKKIYGKDIYLSATRIDTYCKCAFSYFCRYGLKAKTVKKAEIDVLLRGTLIHYILEQIFAQKGRGICDMSSQDIQDFCHGAAMQYFTEKNIDPKGQTPRFQHMLRELIELTVELIFSIQCELLNTDFDPVAFELEIGGDEVQALRVPLDDGNLYVRGSVDRVDVAQINGKNYVRVLDYKSGKKKFALQDVLYGLNLQMLIYLYAILKNGNGKYGEYPAGILYKSAKREFTDADKKSSNVKMSGLLCKDTDVITAMEKSCPGDTVPVRLNKDGSFHSSSSVLPEEDFSAVFLYIEKILGNIGNQLHDGNIAIDPLDGSSESACKYCDYKMVCRREANAHSKEIEGGSISDTIQQIRGEKDGV